MRRMIAASLLLLLLMVSQPILWTKARNSSSFRVNSIKIVPQNTQRTTILSNLLAGEVLEKQVDSTALTIRSREPPKVRWLTAYDINGDKTTLMLIGSTEIIIDHNLLNESYLSENGYIIEGMVPIIFMLDNVDEVNDFMQTLRDLGIRYIKRNDFLPFIYAGVPLEKIEEITSIWDDALLGIYLNYKMSVHLSESVELIKNHTIWSNIESKYGMEINGSGVVVAVLDTGIDTTHPDLDDLDDNPNTTDPKVILEKSFVDFDYDGIPDESPSDGYGHGTHVASIIAGTGYASNYTYVGVAPGAYLINGKVLCNEGYGYTSWIIDGITWAVNNSADVINLSLGGSGGRNDPLAIAVNWAMSQNVVVVVAAGNEWSYGSISCPGVADDVITVGAVNKNLGLASFSSKGPVEKSIIKPDVVAPGVDIIAARAANTSMGSPIDDFYTKASGTSMATPHVSGAVALILQIHPEWNATLIKSVLMGTAVDLGYHPFEQGSGLVNVSAAAEADIAILPPSISFNDNLAFNDSLELDFDILSLTNISLNISMHVNFTRYVSYVNKEEAIYLREEDILLVPSEFQLESGELRHVTIILNISSYPDGYFNGTVWIETGNGRVYRVIFAFYKMSIIHMRVFGPDGKNLFMSSSEIVSKSIMYGAHTENYTYVYGEISWFGEIVNGTATLEVIGNKTYTVFAMGIVVLKINGSYSDYAFYVEKNVTVDTPDVSVDLNVSMGKKYVLKAPKSNDIMIAIDVHFIVFYQENDELKFYRGIGYLGYDYFIGDRIFYISNTSKEVEYSCQFTPSMQQYHSLYMLGYYSSKADPNTTVIEPDNFTAYKIYHDIDSSLNRVSISIETLYDVWAFWFWRPPVWVFLMAPWIYTHPSEIRDFYFWMLGNWKFDYEYITYVDVPDGSGNIITSENRYGIDTHVPSQDRVFVFGSKEHLPGRFLISNYLKIKDIGKSTYDSLIYNEYKAGRLDCVLMNQNNTVVWEQTDSEITELNTPNLANGSYTLKMNVTFNRELWNKTLLTYKFNKTSDSLELPTITDIEAENYFTPGESIEFNLTFSNSSDWIDVYWRTNSSDWIPATSISYAGNERWIISIGPIPETRHLSVKIEAGFDVGNLTYIIENFALPVIREQLTVYIRDVYDYREIVISGNLTAEYKNDTNILNYTIVKVELMNISTIILLTNKTGGFTINYSLTEEHIGKTGYVIISSKKWFVYSGIKEVYQIYIGVKPNVTIEYPMEGEYFKDIIFINGTAIDIDDDVAAIYVRINDVTDWILANGTTEWSAKINASELEEGEYVISVKAVDEHGLYEEESITITIDRTPPSLWISELPDKYTRETTLGITWDGYDALSGIDHYEVSIDQEEWINIGLNTSYTLMNLSQGAHEFRIRAYDRVGNYCEKTISFVVDYTPPELSITPSGVIYTNNHTVLIRWEARDNVSGIDHYEVRLDEGEWVNVGNLTEWNFAISSEGDHEIYVRAFDRAGNNQTARVVFVTDYTPPGLEILQPTNGSYLNDHLIIITWQAQDDVSGIDHYEVRLDEGEWLNLGVSTYYGFADLTEDMYEVYVRAYDLAGNFREVKLIFMVDYTAPSITVLSPANNTEIKNTSITIIWEGYDNLSGIQYYEISLDNGSWIYLGTETSYQFSDLEEGEHWISIRAVDKAGNVRVVKIIVNIKISKELWIWSSVTIILFAMIIALIGIVVIRIRRR